MSEVVQCVPEACLNCGVPHATSEISIQGSSPEPQRMRRLTGTFSKRGKDKRVARLAGSCFFVMDAML